MLIPTFNVCLPSEKIEGALYLLDGMNCFQSRIFNVCDSKEGREWKKKEGRGEAYVKSQKSFEES